MDPEQEESKPVLDLAVYTDTENVPDMVVEL